MIFDIQTAPYLERAAHALRGNGHAVDDALLQYLSPLGWEHINLRRLKTLPWPAHCAPRPCSGRHARGGAVPRFAASPG
ncbi:Tn3 family transposase [Enterobacter cloacae]|uniref:Tn3 family transposase n=1 Tax=Enterobacter cloacae TaxID=550 RepID=UPI00359C99B3